MATRYIYMDDDVCRKEDFPGHVTYRPTEIDFGDYGEANMYVHAYVQYSDTGSLNPVLHIEAMLDGADIVSSAGYYDEMSLRYAVSISYDGHGTSVLNFDDPVNANGHQRIWYANYTVPIKTGRVGEYGNPSRNVDLIGLGMGTGKSMDIPLAYQGCAFSFQIGIYRWNGSGWTSVTSSYEYQSYAPFQTPVTPPNNVYANGVNTFSAVIGAAYTSRIKSQISEYSTFDGKFFDRATDQPVRNVNAPYITSGSQTSVIYWNGGIYSNSYSGTYQYALSVELTITDPGNSSFKIPVSVTVVSGAAAVNATPDTSAYTVSLFIADTAGYVSQFGYMLKNTDSIIRATANVTVQYGATAKVIMSTFMYGYRELEEVTDTCSLTYDQYVPNADTNITRIYVTAKSGEIASSSFQYPVAEYAQPIVSNLSVHRCEQDGTPNDNGSYARVEWGIVVSPINNLNDWTLVIQLPSGKKTYTHGSGTGQINYYTYNAEELVAADPGTSYQISFKLSDSVSSGENATVRTVSLSTAGVIMDWLYGGNGVSFGKSAEQEYALEVSDTWDLIAHKMLLNDVNLVSWVKEIATRMDAIEQFAFNTGSTSQFQVTFYNGTEIVKQEWTLSGEMAVFPSETPTKESTKAETFTFLYWAANSYEDYRTDLYDYPVRGHSTAFAYYSSAPRTYLVTFYRDYTEAALRTFNAVEYHQGPDYEDYDDLSPTPPTGASFIGWCPSGRCIEGATKALARFYYDTEITDTWAEIVAACADGSYKDKYKPGNWKMLDLGAQGNIKMRIKGLDLHRMSGQQKAPISWEADNPLTTQKKMFSTTASKSVIQDGADGFVYIGDKVDLDKNPYLDYYGFTINPYADSANNSATLSITVSTMFRSDLLMFIVENPNSGYVFHVDMYVNGNLISEGVYDQGLDVLITLSIGTTTAYGGQVTFDIIAYTDDCAEGFPNIIIKDWGGTDSSGNEAYHGITVSYTISKVDTYTYSDGGAFGGFAKSELHTWLQNTVKPLFPEALRMGLRKMRLIQSNVKPKTDYPNYDYVENDWLETDLFIPSSEEIVGNTDGNTEGVDFDVWDLSKRKKGNASSTDFYWCRDVSPAGTGVGKVNRYSGIAGSGSDLEDIHIDSQLCTAEKPVYICFCT